MSKQSKSLFDLPFLGRGFRPFFMLGAVHSVFNLLIWAGYYAGIVIPPDIFLDPVAWHAHEMIYGFAMAIIAGFLLTAVANWTGGAPARQLHLLGLCLIWLAGRVVMNVSLGLSEMTVFIVQNSFIPALAISLSIPLLKSWNTRNFVFLGLLTFLFSCNLVFCVTESRAPLYGAVMVIVAMISLVGGRIIPAFTVAAIRRRGTKVFQTSQNKTDAMAFISLVSIAAILLVWGKEGIALGIVAIFSAFIHLFRMRVYHTLKILNDPMVWILHVGYAWVIVGLFLLGLSALSVIPLSIALHALTAGAIGSMTIGMMCRVSLGHTGRELVANKPTVLMFIIMQIAIVVRVYFPLMLPEYTSLWIIISACLWSLCFGLFALTYSSILWRSRPDGGVA
jgi:uncharacterized protein involved in response to NO